MIEAQEYNGISFKRWKSAGWKRNLGAIHTLEPTWIFRCCSEPSSELQMLSARGYQMQLETDFITQPLGS
jgi:hypothetical protein